MLYVICLCEDSASEPPEPPDDPEDYVMILVACLSIAGVALIVILVICLKKRSYSEWKSMDIPSLRTWYYVHCWSYGCCGGTCCHALYCIPSTFITFLIYTEDVTLCKYCCQVHCYETFILVCSGSPWRKCTRWYRVIGESISCTWWYRVMGERMSVVRGDTKWWERACQLYLVIWSDGREHVICTWWYGVMGESMSVVHGDTEWWERACQLYLVIRSDGREHVSCTWWYGVMGESMSFVHGDMEWWERACQLYLVIEW